MKENNSQINFKIPELSWKENKKYDASPYCDRRSGTNL